ncbi:hypothetical protein LEP1GSC163_3184 [Leptospira santarosai str. CBC379]|uniref:Uncharacterized protein n=1 Tax=Leptospira santarosai TaxID=28183 RepID=A0A2P1QQR7_9LEPT|nr:Uncharacterized protein XB16_0925 [Leptospira santarosai]EKR91057.1 hypothetical protein LEP1GSC163_3184 [Leptospira santarosai str. CBC379]EMJ45872.1 hypothetical protein LEP1GSC169_0055 [Leptospira santarosai str. HAI1349]
MYGILVIFFFWLAAGYFVFGITALLIIYLLGNFPLNKPKFNHQSKTKLSKPE